MRQTCGEGPFERHRTSCKTGRGPVRFERRAIIERGTATRKCESSDACNRRDVRWRDLPVRFFFLEKQLSFRTERYWQTWSALGYGRLELSSPQSSSLGDRRVPPRP